jgi:23S rRNA pseudouridine1911/1915/1917 synthase
VSDGSRAVVASDSPRRLETFVRAAMPSLSRRLVRRLIADGTVRVNGRPAPKGAALAVGDVVDLPAPPRLVPEPGRLAVLYADDAIVAVDKPGGVPGHALDPRERGTVAARLLARYPELAGVGDPLAPGLVHRLDTGTSGVLVAARTPVAFAELRAAFRAHAVAKRYVAIVAGMPEPGLVIDAPLAHDPSNRRRMRAALPGDRAWRARSTILEAVAHGATATVVVEIRTGVTHQVRAHLALAGHPVLNDPLYGGPPAALPPGRHALHGQSVRLRNGVLTIAAPLPADLAALGA